MHRTLYIAYYTLYITHFYYTVYSVYYTVYSVYYTVHSVQCTVYFIQCTVNSVQCTVHSVSTKLYCIIELMAGESGIHFLPPGAVQCSVEQCTLYTVAVQYTLHQLHWKNCWLATLHSLPCLTVTVNCEKFVRFMRFVKFGIGHLWSLGDLMCLGYSVGVL